MARPATYDRNTVLEKATNTFWEHGYFATSMTNLVESTRLNPGSIYAAFTSKEGLLLASIDYYGERSLNRVTQVLAAAKSPMEGIRLYLEQLITDGNASKLRRGCFLVNTVLEVAPHNPTVKEKVNFYLSAIEGQFTQALQTARKQGELSQDKDPKILAKYLMVNIWGIRVLQRLSPTSKNLKDVTKLFLQLLES